MRCFFGDEAIDDKIRQSIIQNAPKYLKRKISRGRSISQKAG
jgi:hypothetical protein